MFRSIVVGTDGSETAGKAVEEAIALAKARRGLDRAGLRLRAGPDAAAARGGARAPADMQWMVNPREDVDATLREAVRGDPARPASTVTPYAREGDPADAILDVAEERGADLIVVGNKGMTGAKRFLLGSVPNKVSHHAPCSVLIIRTT